MSTLDWIRRKYKTTSNLFRLRFGGLWEYDKQDSWWCDDKLRYIVRRPGQFGPRYELRDKENLLDSFTLHELDLRK